MLEMVRKQLWELERGASEQPVCLLKKLTVTGCAGQNHVGAGLRRVHEIALTGPVGDYGFCSFGDGECRIEGTVGNYFGHSIHSGIIIVNGHAGHSLGALGIGGTIAVYGNAGDRVATCLRGGEVLVRGSVGKHAGIGMQNGCLIIGGNAGPNLGHQMRHGTIYLRGDAESVSSDVEEHRLREPDRLKIGLLMLKAGIKASGKDFKVYRHIHSEL
jgi:methylamine---glutamate N-methyltransferase subunit B